MIHLLFALADAPLPAAEPAADNAPIAAPATAQVLAPAATPPTSSSEAAPPAVSRVPVGRAAPPTEAATRGELGLHGERAIRAGLEVFASYTYLVTKNQDGSSSWFHAFDLPRAHAAVEGEMDKLRGRVLVEAARSASEGALIGVAGDSLILRIREAYGAYRPVDGLEIAMGVIPTLTIPELDGTWMMRAVAPSALESTKLSSPADLGIRARYELPEGYGFVAAAAYNGEGYTSRELNRGKTIEGAVEIHPLPNGVVRPLGIFGSYTSGSTGTSLARADRATGGLVWQGAIFRAGAFVTWAHGVQEQGSQNAMVASGFVRVEPVRNVLIGGRLDHVVRDTGAEAANQITTLVGALGYRIAEPVEVFATITRKIPTTRAQSEVPGSDDWELSGVARVVF